MLRLVSASVLLLASAAGCVIVDPACAGSSATVIVTPRVVVVSVGGSATPHASWCDHGQYEQVSPRWSLARAEDGTVISLDAATGRITGKRVGQAAVVATYGAAGGESRIEVTVR